MINIEYTFTCDICGREMDQKSHSINPALEPYNAKIPRVPLRGKIVGQVHVCDTCFQVAAGALVEYRQTLS